MSEASVEARLWLMATVIAEGRHCDDGSLHWLVPWEPVVYCRCGWRVELSEDEIQRVLDGNHESAVATKDDTATLPLPDPNQQHEEEEGMSETVDCEESVSGYPLRVAGGFPCPYPAKFTMESPSHSSVNRRKRVCGIHRRVLLREHWEEVQP